MGLISPRGGGRPWRTRRQQILNRDGYRCRYCGGLADSVDHVFPRAMGGSDNYDNLVASCTRCNLRKGDRLPGRRAAPPAPRPVKPPPPPAPLERRWSREW